ncbi:MAG: Hsp20 family protein [Candidatus Anstonellales archaeon]
MTKERKKKRFFGMDDMDKDIFSPFFHDDIEKIMEEMRRMMLKLMEDIGEEAEEKKNVKSKVYGINITIGPEGEVDIKQFGDFPTKVKEKSLRDTDIRQPLVEVHRGEKELRVVAELPGVEEKDINTEIKEKKLIIKAKNKITGRDYYREIDLPYNATIKKKTYKNGILEIDLDRQ